jgi:hypothetical protein
VGGEHDALEIGPDESHLLEEGESFFDDAVSAGDDDAESTAPQPMDCIDVAGGILERQTGGSQKLTDFAADRGLTGDDENSAQRDLPEGPG